MTHRDESRSPESLVREAIARWREGEEPDAQGFLQAHPEIRERKTLAIDLIYEEYCLRQEHGETFVASTFMNRFPAYKQSLARMLDVHQFLAGGSPPAPPSWPQIGEVFLGFEITEQIGAGAVAKVYLAREVEVGSRPVVIKVSQFGRGEARLLGRLTHPGVVPIHSVREDLESGMTCICMPFLGTATLVDVLDQAFALASAPASGEIVSRVALGYLPDGIDPSLWPRVDPFYRKATYEEAIVHLGRQIVAALAKAHQSGITHRDIKPSNVLLARDGRPMLLDFNLSTDQTVPAERVGGTLAYMAPERIEALRRKEVEDETVIDPRSDLYSVGAMMFELLTGQLPSRPPEGPAQRQPTLSEWIQCRREPAPSARKLNPRIEPGLEVLLQRCLAPWPADRYGSATELLTALETLLAPRARLARRIRRRRRLLLAAGLGLAAAGLAGSAYWLSLPPLPVRLYEAGLAAYDTGDYRKAESLFSQSIAAGNKTAAVYFARGQARRQLGDVAGQEKDFLALGNIETGGQASILLAVIAQHKKEARKAKSLYLSARQAGWDTVIVAHGMAMAYCDLKQFGRSIEEFDRIISKEGYAENVQFNRTLAWLKFTNEQNGVVPDERSLQDAQGLSDGNREDKLIRTLVAFLFSNAAKLDPNHRKTALDHLDTAESLGTPPLHTYAWRLKVDPKTPLPPPPPPGTSLPALDLNWRLIELPDTPRYDEFLMWLRADKRLN